MTDIDMQLARLGVKVAPNTPHLSKARILAAVKYTRSTALPSLGRELAGGLHTLALAVSQKEALRRAALKKRHHERLKRAIGKDVADGTFKGPDLRRAVSGTDQHFRELRERREKYRAGKGLSKNTLLSAVDRINERMFGVKPTDAGV